MTSSSISDQTSPDSTKLGGWLFRHRTALPLPIAAVILGLRVGEAAPSVPLVASGVGMTVAGELIRLWGVRHIGAISRTRSDRLGPLIDSGPFAMVRNPLYVGNILLWMGFALAARMVWVAPFAAVLLGIEYHAIVRWEEQLLVTRLGDVYREYAGRVPRWIPALHHGARGGHRGQHPYERDSSSGSPVSAAGASFSWRKTLFSERGTLVAIAVGYALLWLKAQT
jgi:protein-S-isoprenylcysteine O-methyltransferase Ste14